MMDREDWNIQGGRLLCWSRIFMVNSSINCIRIEWLVGGYRKCCFRLCNELVEGFQISKS